MRNKIMMFCLTTLICSSAIWAQKFGNTPDDSIACITNNSLYQGFYSQKNYKDAYEPWKKALEICPQYNRNLYVRGVNILRQMIQSAKDAQARHQFEEELLDLYDKRAEYMGDKANNMVRKVVEMKQLRPTQIKEAYDIFVEAVKEGGNEIEDQFKPIYLATTIAYLQFIKADTDQMGVLFEAYDYASSSLDRSLAKAKNDKEKKQIQEYISSVEQMIEPFSNCEKIVEIYQPKFEEGKTDVAFLQKVTTLLERKRCLSSDLFFQATEALHELQPSGETALLMGRMCLEKKEYTRAVSFFDQAIEHAATGEEKAKIAFSKAQALSADGQYVEARKAANQATSFDASFEGKAAMLIARMYYASVASCASHDGEIKGAAWAAYDKANRAKNADPSLADDAQQMMNACVRQWPTAQTIFFQNLEEGASFRVECWIGETTTVRGRQQ